MTGANSKPRPTKNGQAMVEFLIGLVGLLLLILGLHQAAVMVNEDFDSLIGSREEVADMLVSGRTTGGAAYSGANQYQAQGDFYDNFATYINYEGFGDLMEPYELERVGFESAIDGDAMSTMIGYQDGANIEVESGLLRRVMGNRMLINNEVWMPSWEPLMPEE